MPVAAGTMYGYQKGLTELIQAKATVNKYTILKLELTRFAPLGATR